MSREIMERLMDDGTRLLRGPIRARMDAEPRDRQEAVNWADIGVVEVRRSDVLYADRSFGAVWTVVVEEASPDSGRLAAALAAALTEAVPLEDELEVVTQW